MRLFLTRLENIMLTIIIIPLTLFLLFLLSLVRLGDYIVNLCAFYFYKLIRKLTSSLQLQEFVLRNITVMLRKKNSWSGQFHYRRAAFSSQLKSKIGNILTKTTVLRITLNIDGALLTSRSPIESPIALANLSFINYINLVSIFRCSSPPHNTVYVSRVDLSDLAFSLSSHRHSYVSLLFNSLFIVSYQTTLISYMGVLFSSRFIDS